MSFHYCRNEWIPVENTQRRTADAGAHADTGLRPPTAGCQVKLQAGLRACEGHEGLHLPMQVHSGVSKASLAYRCGGSAGLVVNHDAPASRFTLRAAAQDT
ncbi:hypothetical protein KU43P_33050 [Pseudomonas sp. KU43P]|nr:hypothetical protein KU43P_33050 [Pseudomonas sp. KU43P]